MNNQPNESEVTLSKGVDFSCFSNYLPYGLGILVVYLSWGVISKLTLSQVQPIASTVATISGILLGFILASISLLYSSKNNSFVLDMKNKGYLKKLLSKLNAAFIWLFGTCIIFLISMFITEDINIGTYKILTVILSLGIVVLIKSLFSFYFVWREVSKFSEFM